MSHSGNLSFNFSAREWSCDFASLFLQGTLDVVGVYLGLTCKLPKFIHTALR